MNESRFGKSYWEKRWYQRQGFSVFYCRSTTTTFSDEFFFFFFAERKRDRERNFYYVGRNIGCVTSLMSSSFTGFSKTLFCYRSRLYALGKILLLENCLCSIRRKFPSTWQALVGRNEKKMAKGWGRKWIFFFVH